MCNRIIASVLAIVIGVFSFAVTAQESPKAAPVSEVQKESVSATEAATSHADSPEATAGGEVKEVKKADKGLSQQEKAKQLSKNDPYGGALTILSMCIVVAALAVLSILFLCFGRISSALQKQRKQKAHGAMAVKEHEEEDSGEVIAAIAAALAEHYSGRHDMEDYILTMRSMKRSYSPWNSKIYNLRVLPQVKH